MDIASARLASPAGPSPAAETAHRRVFGSGSLLRGVYRALLYQGRSYAAFSRPHVLPLVARLGARGEILDPMAGYGSLLSFCAEQGASSFCLEMSVPLYLWQTIIHPANTGVLTRSVHNLLSLEQSWPRAGARAVVSDEWFPDESQRLLLGLFGLCRQATQMAGAAPTDVTTLALALLIPFSGRLAAWVPDGAVTRVKQGGMCVYRGWEEDLKDYLLALRARLEHVESTAKSRAHTIRPGDCRSFAFDRGRYSAMITAPPGPLSTSLAAVFEPEDACLSWLADCGMSGCFAQPAAAAPPASGRGAHAVQSETARRFLSELHEAPECDARADAQRYASYFAGLEQAYENLAPSLSRPFEGYVIVTDDEKGGYTVPASGFTVETWQRLGFAAEVYDSRERLRARQGKPRVAGHQVRRTEHTIKVWRR